MNRMGVANGKGTFEWQVCEEVSYLDCTVKGGVKQ